MISRRTILFGLVILVPFAASATTIILAVRALMRVQPVNKGSYLPARTIFRAIQPVQFWSEILFCGTFLLPLGLMLVGHDPRWFHEIILQSATRHHGVIQH
ncbi:MAG TPA: hypothetical protein VEV37_02540 [Bryobacteraceae bacterium]|nr:hypothetical protein [Bryobacteraceae bacterium]